MLPRHTVTATVLWALLAWLLTGASVRSGARQLKVPLALVSVYHLLGRLRRRLDALALIIRSGDGLLRRTRNLCLSSLLEAVRDQTRIVDLKQVNRVLLQPHWRKDYDGPIA